MLSENGLAPGSTLPCFHQGTNLYSFYVVKLPVSNSLSQSSQSPTFCVAQNRDRMPIPTHASVQVRAAKEQ
jgi:hypothetical protein